MTTGNWTNRFSNRFGPSLIDLGTVFLGAAAIFLTRAFPSSSFNDFDSGMMAVCVACIVIGISLRMAFRT